MAELIGEGGLVARLSGAEFAILPSRRTDDLTALAAIVEDVIACVHEPVRFDDITLQVDTSVGVARFPSDGTDAQTLLQRADSAMYSAKAEHDRYRFYAPDQDRQSVSRLAMVSSAARSSRTTRSSSTSTRLWTSEPASCTLPRHSSAGSIPSSAYCSPPRSSRSSSRPA